LHHKRLGQVLVQLRELVAIEDFEPRKSTHDLKLVSVDILRAGIPSQVQTPQLQTHANQKKGLLFKAVGCHSTFDRARQVLNADSRSLIRLP
jgi:hypothetical protein